MHDFSVLLDRLGLTPGRSYILRLFYAQRRSQRAVFMLRTNVLLQPLLPIADDMYD